MKTLPSVPVFIADVPEPASFKATFEYNFFTRDELVSDGSPLPSSLQSKTGENIDAEFFDSIDLKTRVPRYVKLSFAPVKVTPATSVSQPAQYGTPTKVSGKPPTKGGLAYQGISVGAHLDRIISEEEFSNFAFTGVGFQDTAIDGKLYFLASGSITSRINSVPSLAASKALFKPSSPGVTFNQAAKYLNSSTPTTVDPSVTAAALAQYKAKAALYLDDARRNIVNATFDQLKKVDVRVQLNNKHAFKLLSRAVYDSASIFCDELAALLPSAENAETVALQSAKPGLISLDEYESKLKYVSIEDRNPSLPQLLSTKIVGYVIDKYEHPAKSGAPLIPHPTIVVENPDATLAIDTAVRYGVTYSYSVRAVATVEFPARPTDGSNRLFTVTALVASRPAHREFVTCVESVPPPPPADFNVSWDYGRNKPRLTWSMPVNSQRDVKKIQVFRRESLNESFRLVKMYDFNDATNALPDIETIDQRLIEQSLHPVMLHIDRGFEVGRTAIYALCSIDAHGLSSGYSMQFEVSFDRLSNRIVKRVLSPSGAPKSYPNAYLNRDLFIDAVRCSGKDRLRIAFMPEVIELATADTADAHFLSTDKTGGTYRLQLINVDVEKQQDLDITIKDLRKTKKQ